MGYVRERATTTKYQDNNQVLLNKYNLTTMNAFIGTYITKNSWYFNLLTLNLAARLPPHGMKKHQMHIEKSRQKK